MKPLERSSGARHVLYYIEHAKLQNCKLQARRQSSLSLSADWAHDALFACNGLSTKILHCWREIARHSYRYTQRVKGVWVFLSSPKNDRPLAFSGDKYARKSLSLSAHLQITTHTSITLKFFFFFLFSFFHFFNFPFMSSPLSPIPSLCEIKEKYIIFAFNYL